MSKIAKIEAEEIISSGGMPTVEATVVLDSGKRGTASVPFGASAGEAEAVTLTDGDMDRYQGKGMKLALTNIVGEIQSSLLRQEAGDQAEIDRIMIDLDGTRNKSRLGGNAILAVSLPVARAEAEEEGIPLYRYINKLWAGGDMAIPTPMVVMIEGGKHADNSADFQEYLLIATGGADTRARLETASEVYQRLKIILEGEGFSTNVGNEGALVPEGVSNNEKPLEYLTRAVGEMGLEISKDVNLGIDPAASEFYDSGSKIYDLRIEHKKLLTNEMVEYYLQLIGKYGLATVEDGLAESDWEGWQRLQERIGNIVNIGDDLTVTNVAKLQQAIETKAISGIVVKPNQVGTLTETLECCRIARKNGIKIVVSHRGGGETNDTFIADLAVAVGAEYLKCGIVRGERVEKWNRVVEIEEEIS